MLWRLPTEANAVPLSWEGDVPPALLWGYSVFTTFRWPLQQHRLASHVQRLQAHANALGMDFPWTLETIQESLSNLYSETETVIRLTVLPQDVREEVLFAPHPLPAYLLTSRRPAPPEDRRPLQVEVASYTRPMPQFKHGNYLNDMYHYRLARQKGLDEVLRVNEGGKIAEAAMANVFFMDDHGLWTPQPEADGCLAGITRTEVITLARTHGIPVQEKALTWEQARSMQGAFLTNAVRGLRRVQALLPSEGPLFHLVGSRQVNQWFQTLERGYANLEKGD